MTARCSPPRYAFGVNQADGKRPRNVSAEREKTSTGKSKGPARILMGLACLIGLTDIILVTVGNSPVTPSLAHSGYKLEPIVENGITGTTQSVGAVSNLLSTNFTITIPSRLKGQRVEINKVDFFTEQDVFLGSASVSGVTLDGPEAFSLGSNPAGSAVIPPLSRGLIRFRASLKDTAGLSPETKIYTQVQGTAGKTNFRARSKASQTTGASS